MDRSHSYSYWREFIPESWIFLKKGYSLNFFRKDLFAGMTVGIVALPLAMAFAIASGVSPSRGLYTAIIAGFLISLLGGSRFQIGGPTGAFVVIIYEIVERLGYEGLVVVTILASLLLLISAFSRFGSLIKYIPYPLITGFTTGIAVIIFSSQVKDFLGLNLSHLPADFLPKWSMILSNLNALHIPTFALSLGTLAIIIMIRRYFPIIPWGIAGVVIATLVAWIFSLPVETIQTRFGEIERTLPLPSLAGFKGVFSNITTLFSDAITIAFLAGIEALLSAVVADGMGGTRHRSNCELMGQGFANLASVICGGIPATGAIARTATNIKSGAKTPIAGMIHALTLLMILLFFAPIVSKIPLAALSAVLVMVAWNMSEVHHFRHLFKAPVEDIVVLLATFFLTVLVDLTIAVEIGMILALFLFMRKMRDHTGITSLKTSETSEAKEEIFDREKLPRGVEIFEMTGPFFFGVADSLKSALTNLEFPPQVFILRMKKVSMIDASGMHALREFHDKCVKEKTLLLLTGVHPPLHKCLKKFEITQLVKEEHIFETLKEALIKAEEYVSIREPLSKLHSAR